MKMTDECEIENRLDDRRRALRHLKRAIGELELAGCDDIKARLEASHRDLMEMTPGSDKPRRKLVSVGATDLARVQGFTRRSGLIQGH